MSDPRPRAAWRHVHHDTVASTNAAALDLADGVTPGEAVWVTADRQSAGRGRRGRAWVSAPGNLHATVVMCPPAPPHPTLPLAAAVALHAALVRVVPQAREAAALKWPNDMLWRGRKLAGILIEVHHGERGPAVAIGFGVNVAGHPSDLNGAATSLRAEGIDLEAAALARSLMGVWSEMGDAALAGMDDVRERWLALATGLGGPVTVRLPDREIDGTFEGLDAAGRLVLRRTDGTSETIAAGDVFARPAPAPLRDTNENEGASARS